MKIMTADVKTFFEKKIDAQKEKHDNLHDNHTIQKKILTAHVKKDPLPREKIDEIKAEIMEEIEGQMSPRNGKGGRKFIGSESSKIVDSEDDIDALDVEQTSMKDLIQ